MADRTVYGHTHSENGWRMVDAGSCRWVTVPGTNVTLQIREGQPEKILAAFAADYNAYVEPLRDPDSACWTATNSVATSNHLSGTAMDLNWNGPDGRTFRFGISEERAYPPPKNRAVRDLLDWYEGMVYCGGFWNIQDWMHFQMGYNTYGPQNVDKVNDFIRRKIRPDGFSTYRRAAAPPPPVSKADQYALAIIAEGRRRGITPRGIKIALATALVESNLRMYANSTVPESLNLPHDAVGSDHDSVGLFQQRHPMWGPLEVLMDPTKSAGLFYDHLQRMNYNDESRSPGSFAADIQRPAAQYRGRYDERFGEASALYDRLATEVEDDWMANPELERMIREVHAALFNRVVSESRYRHLGEGPRWQLHEMIRHVNAFAHEEFVEREAREGDPEAIALVYEIANADPQQHPDRQKDAQAARRFLDSLSAAAPASSPGAAASTVQHYEPETVTAELVEPDGVSQTVSAIAQQLLERAAQQVQKSLR